MLTMHVPLAVLADAANVSLEGKLNIFGIFNRIWAVNFPAHHPQMQLVLAFEADTAEAEQVKPIEVQLRDSDGKKMVAISGRLKVPKGEPGQPIRINHIFPLPGLGFEKPGDYVFKILVNGETKTQVPFAVAQVMSRKEKKQ